MTPEREAEIDRLAEVIVGKAGGRFRLVLAALQNLALCLTLCVILTHCVIGWP